MKAVAAESADVGERIRAARDARGLSQAELAAAVGVKQQSISKIEGGGGITLPVLARLAEALDTTTDALLGRPDSLALAASHGDLDVLREVDPAAYERLREQAAKAVAKARTRRLG